MKKLTNKEKEIMDLYWQHGPMFVKEEKISVEELKELIDQIENNND